LTTLYVRILQFIIYFSISILFYFGRVAKTKSNIAIYMKFVCFFCLFCTQM